MAKRPLKALFPLAPSPQIRKRESFAQFQNSLFRAIPGLRLSVTLKESLHPTWVAPSSFSSLLIPPQPTSLSVSPPHRNFKRLILFIVFILIQLVLLVYFFFPFFSPHDPDFFQTPEEVDESAPVTMEFVSKPDVASGMKGEEGNTNDKNSPSKKGVASGSNQKHGETGPQITIPDIMESYQNREDTPTYQEEQKGLKDILHPDTSQDKKPIDHKKRSLLEEQPSSKEALEKPQPIKKTPLRHSSPAQQKVIKAPKRPQRVHIKRSPGLYRNEEGDNGSNGSASLFTTLKPDLSFGERELNTPDRPMVKKRYGRRKGNHAPIDTSPGPMIANGKFRNSFSSSISGSNQFYGAMLGSWLQRHMYYPSKALEKGAQGVVKLIVKIDSDGNIISIDLVGRSGSDDLDLGAQGIFRGRRVPHPPPQKDNQPYTFGVDMHFSIISN
ncbi:energy transducer TonB [Entomobacter blattae]|uniref:TonB C-terminal domain-containing protein n=1 Tax=Entomobacter blattae TaxID=2762277 RepID=A0A7H1NTA6_9PROT|nr:energy transducer TonB [Entomobacter blattae]QNT79016.1 hypothetical protein JGUZn3_18020 [Entomobacter blattae]